MTKNMPFTHQKDDHDWFVANLYHYRWKELWDDLGCTNDNVLYICGSHKCNSYKVRTKIWTGRLRPRKKKLQ
jgi:hypothetical protein